MGYRTHLHICQHCGTVQATASETSPKKCVVCDGITFSGHYSNELLSERREYVKEPKERGGRVERISVERVR